MVEKMNKNLNELQKNDYAIGNQPHPKTSGQHQLGSHKEYKSDFMKSKYPNNHFRKNSLAVPTNIEDDDQEL